MNYNYLIENGLLLYPEKTEKKTVAIAGEKIYLLETGKKYEAEQKIDATGCYILPGLIDPHVHPNYADDLGQTSISAAFGGVTTTINYIPLKAGENPLEVIARLRNEGLQKSYIDFAFHASLFDAKNQLSLIKELCQQGIRSFKMFTAYSKLGWLTEDTFLIRAFAEIAANGGMACVHAESGSAIDFLEELNQPLSASNFLKTSPGLLDKEAIFRVICFAKLTSCLLYLPHISSRKALEALTLGREEGAKFYSETCPHYLAFSWDNLQNQGPLGKLRPPVKNQDDKEALWNAIEDMTIDLIGSDHAPKVKKLEDDFQTAPYGAPGVETILPVLWELGVNANRLTPFDLVRLCCEKPAQIFGLAPQKGRLEEGADADLIIFDPTIEWRISASNQHSNAFYTLYEGLECRGKILKVFSRGQLLIDEDKLIGCPGKANFLATHPLN